MPIETGISVRNYKNFAEEKVGFGTIKNVNIIIGKNNVGKSSLLDAIDFAINPTKNSDLNQSKIVFSSPVKDNFRSGFNINPDENNETEWSLHGEGIIGSTVYWTARQEITGQNIYVGVHPQCTEHQTSKLKNYVNGLVSYITGREHVRIMAERDIQPETAASHMADNNSQKLSLQSNGDNATQILQYLIHRVHDFRQLITHDLLNALNIIFKGETIFTEITARHHTTEGEEHLWEIYLSEENRDLHALSQSGSGLKTIILILLNFLIRPKIENKPLEKYIFSIEEIENNLHPSLQRSLLKYIEDFCKKNRTHIFITTHSHISIDMYSNSTSAQILHLQKQENTTTGKIFKSHIHGYEILGDLGVRASDLLQANGIIWIEGPSDRIFLNKFISLWSTELKEGKHFQFAFYGGSVLADLDASPPSDIFTDAISVLMINRNAIFVCDGDRTSSSPELKPRVKAICEELDKTKSLYWVTEGKEIENYIPIEAFKKVHPKKFKNGSTPAVCIGIDEPILDYLTYYGVTKAKAYTDKTAKAAAYAEHFTKDNLSFRDEIDTKMREICSEIMSWNNITVSD
jgi:predicted ATPase